MRADRARLLRPFLLGPEIVPGGPVRRVDTELACAALGLEPWHDPHNTDRRHARVRARAALAELEGVLGPGLADGLVRTADLLRADADLLAAHEGLTKPQSDALNARLILILANHIGDPQVLRQALAAAALKPEETT